MPKLKTNRGAMKRLKKTGTGDLKRAASGHNHILTKKSQKRKRRLRAIKKVNADNQRAMHILVSRS